MPTMEALRKEVAETLLALGQYIQAQAANSATTAGARAGSGAPDDNPLGELVNRTFDAVEAVQQWIKDLQGGEVTPEVLGFIASLENKVAGLQKLIGVDSVVRPEGLGGTPGGAAARRPTIIASQLKPEERMQVLHRQVENLATSLRIELHALRAPSVSPPRSPTAAGAVLFSGADAEQVSVLGNFLRRAIAINAAAAAEPLNFTNFISELHKLATDIDKQFIDKSTRAPTVDINTDNKDTRAVPTKMLELRKILALLNASMKNVNEKAEAAALTTKVADLVGKSADNPTQDVLTNLSAINRWTADAIAKMRTPSVRGAVGPEM